MTRFRCLTRLLTVAALSLACVTAAPAVRGDETAETTEQLAEKAYALQAAGKYPEAIATYLKAYDQSKAGLTLLNIATIYDRKLNEPQLAAEYYRRYLMAPDAEPDRVKKVTERLTTLKHAEEQEARARNAVTPIPTTTPSSQPPPEPREKTSDASHASQGGAMRTAGVVMGVLGVVGVGASLVLGYAAKIKNDDANAVCNGAACANQNGVDLASTAGSFATASTIAFIAGLACVGGGIALYALAPRGTPASRAARIYLAPRVDTSGGGMVLHGAF